MDIRVKYLVCGAAVLKFFGIISTFAFVQNFDAQGNPARWDNQAVAAPTNSFNPITRSIRYFLAEDAYSAGNRDAELNSIRAAFAQWQSVPGVSVRFEDAGTVLKDVDINTSDGTNVVFWAKDSPFINGGRDNIAGVLALTYRRVTNDNVIVESDIVLNGLQTSWFSDFFDSSNTGQFIESSVLHEIGHLLGLEHSPVGGATMFARSRTGVGTQAGLSDDEIAAARAIYPLIDSTMGSLDGRVTMNAAPVFGATILLENAFGNIEQGTVSRSDGVFNFSSILPGEYVVRVAPLDPASGNSLTHLITGGDIAPAYTGAQTAFLSASLSANIEAGRSNRSDISIGSGVPAFRVTRVVTPATDPANFRAINAPVQLDQGAKNILIGVCSPGLPSPSATLSISGSDISIGQTISHPDAFSSGDTTLNLLYAAITISSNAVPGLRSFVVSDGTNVAYANGFLEILPPVPDFNFDGLDDRFQRSNFALFTAADAGPSADPDGDRACNMAEFLSGTNPRDAASVLRIGQILFTGSTLEIQWQSVMNKTYRLVYANDLDANIWTAVTTPITASGPATSLVDDTSSGERRFYRIELVK